MTAARARFERELLPAFAARFRPSNLVLNVGVGRHTYRASFPCRVITLDRELGCDVQGVAEEIPYAAASFDGVLMMGVFERLDDPMQTMRELQRVLRPGGFLLLSALDLGFPWRKPCDRWRLSPGGLAHAVRAFTVLESHTVGWAHFCIVQKP